ncbi:hypothetical protein ACSSS7_004326 [Eimeria intestinalis]
MVAPTSPDTTRNRLELGSSPFRSAEARILSELASAAFPGSSSNVLMHVPRAEAQHRFPRKSNERLMATKGPLRWGPRLSTGAHEVLLYLCSQSSSVDYQTKGAGGAGWVFCGHREQMGPLTAEWRRLSRLCGASPRLPTGRWLQRLSASSLCNVLMKTQQGMESLVADMKEGGPPDRALGGPPTRAVSVEHRAGAAATADLPAAAATAALDLHWPNAQAAASAAAAAAAVAAAKAAAAAAAAKKGFEASSSFRASRDLPPQQQQPQQQQLLLQYAPGRLLQQQQQLQQQGQQQQQHVRRDEEHTSQALKPDQVGFGRAVSTLGSRLCKQVVYLLLNPKQQEQQQPTNNCSSSSNSSSTDSTSSNTSSRRDSSSANQNNRTSCVQLTANSSNSNSNSSSNSSSTKVSNNSNNRSGTGAPAIPLASPAAAAAAAGEASGIEPQTVGGEAAAAPAGVRAVFGSSRPPPAPDASSNSSNNNNSNRGKGGVANALVSRWEGAFAALGAWGPCGQRGPLERDLGAPSLAGTAAATAARAVGGAQPQIAATQAADASAPRQPQQRFEGGRLFTTAASAAAAATPERGAAGATAAATESSRSSPAIPQTRFLRPGLQAKGLVQSEGLNAAPDLQQQQPFAAGAAATAPAADPLLGTNACTSCMRVGCRNSSRCSQSSSKSSRRDSYGSNCSNMTKNSSSSDGSNDSSNTNFSNWLIFPPSQAPDWERGPVGGPWWRGAPKGTPEQLLHQAPKPKSANPAAAAAAAASTVATVTPQTHHPPAAATAATAAAADAALSKAAAAEADSLKLRPQAFSWGANAAPASPAATAGIQQQHDLHGSLRLQQQQQQAKLGFFLPRFAAPTAPSSAGVGTPLSLRHPAPLQQQLQHLLVQHQLRLLKQEQCFRRTLVPLQQHPLQILQQQQQQQQQNCQSWQQTFPLLTQQWGTHGPPSANAGNGVTRAAPAVSAAATSAATATAAGGLRGPCVNSGNCSSSSSMGLLSPRGWGSRAPRKRALCVGCLYKGTFCELKGAAADARRWAEAAATKLGFNEIKSDSATPTAAAALAAAAAASAAAPAAASAAAAAAAAMSLSVSEGCEQGLGWLAEGSAAGDVLLLVFSGCSCALLYPQQREGPSTPHTLALLPADFKGWGETRFVSSAEILSFLNRLADDTCLAGGSFAAFELLSAAAAAAAVTALAITSAAAAFESGVQFCGVFDCAFGGRLLPLRNCLTVSAHGKICKSPRCCCIAAAAAAAAAAPAAEAAVSRAAASTNTAAATAHADAAALSFGSAPFKAGPTSSLVGAAVAAAAAAAGVTLDGAADGSWVHPQQYHQQQQQQQEERQQQQQQQQQQRPGGASASKFAGVFHLPQKQLQEMLLQEQAQKHKLSLQRRGILSSPSSSLLPSIGFKLFAAAAVAVDAAPADDSSVAAAAAWSPGFLTALLLEALHKAPSRKQSYLGLAIAAAALQQQGFRSGGGTSSRSSNASSCCRIEQQSGKPLLKGPRGPLTSIASALELNAMKSSTYGRAATATTEVEAAAAKTLSIHHKRAAAASKRESEASGAPQQAASLPSTTLQGGGPRPEALAQECVFDRAELAAHTSQNAAAPGHAQEPGVHRNGLCNAVYLPSFCGAPSSGLSTGAFPSSSLGGFAGAEGGGGGPHGLLARLRRGSVCSLASLAAPSLAAGNTSSAREEEGRFEVYVHSILDLEEKELGQGPMQIRIAPAQQLQQQQEQRMEPLLQQSAEADMHAAAAEALLAVKSSSSSVAPAAASKGLLFLAVRSRIVCSLSAQARLQAAAALAAATSAAAAAVLLYG